MSRFGKLSPLPAPCFTVREPDIIHHGDIIFRWKSTSELPRRMPSEHTTILMVQETKKDLQSSMEVSEVESETLIMQ